MVYNCKSLGRVSLQHDGDSHVNKLITCPLLLCPVQALQQALRYQICRKTDHRQLSLAVWGHGQQYQLCNLKHHFNDILCCALPASPLRTGLGPLYIGLEHKAYFWTCTLFANLGENYDYPHQPGSLFVAGVPRTNKY